MASKIEIAIANSRADQLSALLSVLTANSAQYEENTLDSLISLAFSLSVQVSQFLIDLDKNSEVKNGN